MPNRTNSEIRARVDAFVQDLSGLIRETALQAVQEVLGGRATRTAAPVPVRAAASPRRKKARRKRTGGGKRVDAGTVLAAIQAAGAPVRSETLAGALGSRAPLLKPVLDELVASKQIKRAGMARGTTYEAGSGGGGGASPATKKKATRKRSRKAADKKPKTK